LEGWGSARARDIEVPMVFLRKRVAVNDYVSRLMDDQGVAARSGLGMLV